MIKGQRHIINDKTFIEISRMYFVETGMLHVA